ncbi:helix-turn-helix domain-containing protein [Gorillibacterium sp. CAU 1737]|uniref:helix-turn-helix domain-containing protein n=1 Tax=Gorillibacterium sp. CAU 1737 TaxID=3140362 RepID=UPI003260A070
MNNTAHTMKLNQLNNHNTLTFSEAWEFIFQGKISKDKLYSEVRAGRIPHFRIGTKIYFRRTTLDAWFQEQERISLR